MTSDAIHEQARPTTPTRPTDASAAFIRTEFAATDLNRLRQLARAPSPVGRLDAATKGDRAASLRYREAMRPMGFGEELRVALRIDGSFWGLLCLHRTETTRGFVATDAELLARLGPHLAEGLRRATVLGEFEGGGRMVTVARWHDGAISEEYIWS